MYVTPVHEAAAAVGACLQELGVTLAPICLAAASLHWGVFQEGVKDLVMFCTWTC